jgi:hypothetical protein
VKKILLSREDLPTRGLFDNISKQFIIKDENSGQDQFLPPQDQTNSPNREKHFTNQ